MSEGLVDVHLFAAARAAVGASVVAAESGSVNSILDGLVEKYPALDPIRPRCSYLLDGQAVHDLQQVVAIGSRLDVLPPFAGG